MLEKWTAGATCRSDRSIVGEKVFSVIIKFLNYYKKNGTKVSVQSVVWTVRNVSEGAGYDCIVQAHNRHGWSLPSTIYTYRHGGHGEHCRYSDNYIIDYCLTRWHWSSLHV